MLIGQIPLGKGLRQGCPMSPCLFNVVIGDLDKVLRVGGAGIWVKLGEDMEIPDVLYADDINAFPMALEGVHQALQLISDYMGRKNMKIN